MYTEMTSDAEFAVDLREYHCFSIQFRGQEVHTCSDYSKQGSRQAISFCRFDDRSDKGKVIICRFNACINIGDEYI